MESQTITDIKIMKTFQQLTVGDSFYKVLQNDNKYSVEEVTKVDAQELFFKYSNRLTRKETTRIKIEGDYHQVFIYFTSEVEAVRYCKAQMMKKLFSLIDSAKRSITAIHEYRKENFELLNHEWTEKQINLLERTL